MKETKNKDRYIKYDSSFKPDSEYIKNAIEDFKRRGGYISKPNPTKDTYDKILDDENLHSEP